MPDGGARLEARTIRTLSDVDAAAWDALANPAPETYNPFVAYDFLKCLEDSKSVCSEAGWAPFHLLLENDGRLAGAAPLYIKSHSQGEYVFDHAFADAYERAGGRYYPKLQCSVPFTPATGPRLLDGGDKSVARDLAVALAGVAAQADVSSLHVTFAGQDEQRLLCEAGFLARIDQQFHWTNDGYDSFDDFLAALASRKRKALKKERAAALADNVDVEWAVGADITEAHWDAFWAFYQDTGARKWGYPYLTRTFFRLLGERMADKVLLIFAKRGDRYVAGALNMIGGDALYGRYWGCTEHVPFLHFEICYYQAIDYAIAHGLKRVEAGAQGEHKLARGYAPTPTYSAHYITDPGFRDAVARYLEAERADVGAHIDMLSDFTPFRKGG
ncbi:MAG: GNAT family N-acetyltransferase [Pseudomonadota bacterium]